MIRKNLSDRAWIVAKCSVLVVALSAGAVARTAASSDVPPERISYSETGAHGIGHRQWHVWSGGQGRYQSDMDGAAPVDARLNLGPEGFSALREALHPLEMRREIRCTTHATDQELVDITWARGDQHLTLHIDFGCSPSPGEDALQRARQATTMVRGSTGVSRSNDGGSDLDPGPAVMPEGGVKHGKSSKP